MGVFTGKIILVTGTSSGIGRASAAAIAAEGGTVIAAARRKANGAEVIAAIEKAGGKARFIQTDISDERSVDALFATIESEYGRLDGAFNNAGMEIPLQALPDIPLQEFDEIVRTNLRGTFNCLRHELRIMRAQKSGAVLNTSSFCGVQGLKGSAAYTATKHAIVGLTKTAALDMAALGVRVNCICPGSVKTEMMERWTGGTIEAEQALAQLAPMKRVGRPEELAATAAFFLSDASSYITGHIMMVDGGVSAGLGA